MKKRIRFVIILASVFLLGFLGGAMTFSGVQPRSFLTFHRCNETCLERKELLGLIGSVVMLKIPGALPRVVLETDKTVVIEHPVPQSDIHYVAIPKKDIRNADDFRQEDSSYLIDIFASLQYLIEKKSLIKYRISTNGPDYQTVDYLHFHLRADLPE